MNVAYFSDMQRQGVQEDMPSDAQHRRQMARTINQLQAGHTNTTMTLTIDAGGTTTVIDPRISLMTCVTLMPTTAAAATALASTYIVCSKGQAVIHSTATGAVYTMCIQG